MIKFFSKTWIKNYFLRYIYIYDPGYFSLIYAIKTLIAVFLSILINYFLFGFTIIIWAGLLPIYIYFLNTLIGDKQTKLKYLILFVLLSCLAVFIFSIFAGLGLWLFIPVVVLTFVVGMSSVYNTDLQKVLSMVLINGLVACIYINSNMPISLRDEILTIFIGGMIGISMHFFISFGKYGKFTKKNFPTLLFDLELMIKNIDNSIDYIKIRNQTLTQIETIKYILNSKAGKIKDPYLIKNTKRTLFYLYRIEEICHSINSIHHYFSSGKNDLLFYRVQGEIINNLKELSRMFEGHRPHLSKNILEEVLTSDTNQVFVSSIKIIYNKIESFRRGGEEEAYLTQPITHKNFQEVFRAFRYKNPTFRYSIKYAIALGATIFIARFLNIDHGIWITMGAMAIVKPNLGSIKDASKEYFLGTFLGFVAGILFVVLFGKTVVFYPLFAIVIFLFIYLRVYPYSIWSAMMMIAFIMMFAMLKEDFLELIFNRLLDVLIAFGVVFGAFWLIWPKYSSDDIMPNIKNSILLLDKLAGMIYGDLRYLDAKRRQFLSIENKFFEQYNLLNVSINDARKENKFYSQEDIQNALKAIKYLDALNQNINKLYDYLLNLPKEYLNTHQELFDNDIKLLITRYEMLTKLIDGMPYYFKEEKDGRFLATEERFSMIIDDIFVLQNQLYLAILSNIKH
ncbi:FUSC family protein [Helicobacter sp. 11S03491-1]|uniref:FUSC family protein n=1 Tax=Helicobacter sp. 11S03491-1 TaxID=1476196 RepID=UPI000BA56C02|nr:FUSC family protein [Helicobacter sp. 11S03491-1]PAF42566.1 hypothetical protein BKH45_03370 [Helicobacter sp. 11S03491-1]